MAVKLMLGCMILTTGCLVSGAKEEAMPEINGKKVLMIVARENFRDEEFFKPCNLLRQKGAVVTVASAARQANGVLGQTVKANLLLTECRAADYDAIVFIGGPGATEYFNDRTAQALARDAVQNGKILAAICIAPVTLANAGVLNGKKATCFPAMEGTLAKQGATLVKQPVVQDGQLLTAVGPEAAQAFGEALARMLAE